MSFSSRIRNGSSQLTIVLKTNRIRLEMNKAKGWYMVSTLLNEKSTHKGHNTINKYELQIAVQCVQTVYLVASNKYRVVRTDQTKTNW